MFFKIQILPLSFGFFFNEPSEINLVRHARKKEEDHQKYQIDAPDDNYQWELVEINKRDGLKAAYYLGIHFYYK